MASVACSATPGAVREGRGLHGHNVVRNDGGRIVYVRRFEFAA